VRRFHRRRRSAHFRESFLPSPTLYSVESEVGIPDLTLSTSRPTRRRGGSRPCRPRGRSTEPPMLCRVLVRKDLLSASANGRPPGGWEESDQGGTAAGSRSYPDTPPRPRACRLLRQMVLCAVRVTPRPEFGVSVGLCQCTPHCGARPLFATRKEVDKFLTSGISRYGPIVRAVRQFFSSVQRCLWQGQRLGK